ncbi:MAG: glycolate oxidase subunit GlcF [Gammaproteobacteria bacterium]
MQTKLSDFAKSLPERNEIESILRACVHCGFCNATCPTYQLLGDEADGPRGRIYLIKAALEGSPVSGRTLLHLDRCLSCRSCETTCPSGVRYGRLLDLGRQAIEPFSRRSVPDRIRRRLIRAVFPFPERAAFLLHAAGLLKPFLPKRLRRKLIERRPPRLEWPPPRHRRKMLVLSGCVQPILAPSINASAAAVLDRLGISLLKAPGEGCCGAISHHLSAGEETKNFVKRNIDAWWPHVEAGAEALVMTASGCGVMVKEYGELLRGEAAYAEKAARISEMTRDIAEILYHENLDVLRRDTGRKVAFHCPCTLQHGQKLSGMVESILTEAGYELLPVADAHLCCGSAGVYSLLQPALSERLLAAKIIALESSCPDVIATANIGCMAHLQTGTAVKAVHWIELLAE